MNYIELQKECADALAEAGISNFSNESRWLILETLALPASVFYDKSSPDADALCRVREACARRCRHEPLQYILGSAPFAELELRVTPDVLIPRCETVVLAEYVLDKIPPAGDLLDVGCGSGAITLLAAQRRRDIRLTAVDKSAAALEIARQNAVSLGVFERISFFESDLFSSLSKVKFDVIAANLPYVTFDEYALLESDVRDYEPEMALTAPDDGMALISQLISEAAEFLRPGGTVALEMSPHQTARAAGELENAGFENISVFPDQFGKFRFVAAQLPCMDNNLEQL